MPFFQNSVINKYLKSQDKEKLAASYVIFKQHFHNPAQQENIRNCKEEQYQEGFLTDLFVEVLGYTKNPKTNFNLTTEYKNIKDSKKADGAIIINEKVKAVIELKGTDTTDLGKVEEQAFGYKNNQPECTYVIISNFEKLRFYVDNAIEHFEFNLFTLTEKEFELLYLCLAFENIVKDLPKQIKNESLSSEDVITKKLYADYSAFRRVLFQNIVDRNPQFDKLALFKKTQKLLDRFLFIFFAEDRQLLPPNSIRTILDQWKQLKELDSYKPLWERFKLYFHYMNVGRKGSQHDIFPYNGGLFLPDIMLDSITIHDDILYEHTLKLSNYDFDTEVDVDVLGHIFEHSLNEIEEIQSQLEGKELDKTKTKRKKDGIFYTPKYITKYIVYNTVGKLCTEKKAELQINEEDFSADKKLQKQTKQLLADKLTLYRNWLLQIKICDPACGSGAFLNQALDFLIKEHRYIDELQAKLFGDTLVLSDIENSILENNLFGVDLNEESVEIARLSLWLRTARPNRKLNDLSNNIKCGNSLIDDPAVAGSKAFNWFLEFPQVFPHYRKPKVEETKKEFEENEFFDDLQEPSYSYKLGSRGFEKYGFDVVIGNPPYGAKIDKNQINYFSSKFDKSLAGEVDTYLVFYFASIDLLKINGFLGFITPDTWLTIQRGIGLRKYIINSAQLLDVYDRYKPFQDAKDTRCHTIIIRKNTTNDYFCEIKVVDSKENIIKSYNLPSSDLKINYYWNLYSSPQENSIFNKMDNHSKKVENFYHIKYGLRTGDNEKYLSEIIDKSINKIKIARGSNIERYYFNWRPEFLMTLEGLPTSYFDDSILNSPKVIIQYVRTNSTDIKSKWLEATLIEENGFVPLNSTSFFYIKNPTFSLKYLLTIISSTLMNFYYKAHYTDVNVKPLYLSKLPIPFLNEESQLPFIQKADLMLSLNKQLHELSQKFQRNIQREFNLQDLPTKLQNWYLLTYTDFIKELDKKKVKLSLSQKAEWEEYFLAESKKAKELKDQIDKTDKEIDQMVYQLYGLTEEEIKIVEGN